MKLLFHLDASVISSIRAMRDYFITEYGLEEFPEELLPTFDLCIQTTINELITLHYTYGITTEQYLATFDPAHIDLMVEMLFEYDETDYLYNIFKDAMDNLVCSSNSFALIIMRHNKILWSDKMSTRPPGNVTVDALAESLCYVICDTLETIDIVRELPVLKDRFTDDIMCTIKDIDVNLQRRRITLYN